MHFFGLLAPFGSILFLGKKENLGGCLLNIDGKAIAASILTKLKKRIDAIEGRKPALAFILVGTDPASQTYVAMKKKRCAEVGIESIDYLLDETIEEEQLLSQIDQLNKDPKIDGILIQLPLPQHIKEVKVIEHLDPSKDVDGFHPLNMGKLLRGDPGGFYPCTPYGVATLLQESGIETEGAHVVIIGRSNIVGKPLAALLMQKAKGANATVTIANSATKNLPALCQSADILICAIGSPLFVTADMVREGAVVIDVGINRKDGKIVGDVDYANVHEKCSAITPVPGGVGPMTIAMLLSNTYLSFERRTR